MLWLALAKGLGLAALFGGALAFILTSIRAAIRGRIETAIHLLGIGAPLAVIALIALHHAFGSG